MVFRAARESNNDLLSHIIQSGLPYYKNNGIKVFNELPEAKLTGLYSAPLLLQLWSAWIKANVDVLKVEVNVLTPIACSPSELNKHNNNTKTGYRNTGAVTASLASRVRNLEVMVPNEWRFSFFETAVHGGDIDCNELEPFRTHMAKHMDSSTNRLRGVLALRLHQIPNKENGRSKEPASQNPPQTSSQALFEQCRNRLCLKTKQKVIQRKNQRQ